MTIRLYIPLDEYVRERRREAADADWIGEPERARVLERDAERAIADGEDPVCMF